MCKHGSTHALLCLNGTCLNGANRLEADDDVSDLGPRDVAVRMLFAPINPSDVNQVRKCLFTYFHSSPAGHGKHHTWRELEQGPGVALYLVFAFHFYL